jgi:hypothetical protein
MCYARAYSSVPGMFITIATIIKRTWVLTLFSRAQGGHNAGHTIVKDGTTFDVHILREPTLLLLHRSLLRLLQPPVFSLKDA